MNIYSKINTNVGLKTESEKDHDGTNGEPWKTKKDPYSMATADPLDTLFNRYDEVIKESTTRKAIQENFFLLDAEAEE